jgi:hypothetical protein
MASDRQQNRNASRLPGPQQATARTPRHYFGVALRLFWSAARIAVRFLARITCFLAASARTTPASDVLNSSIRGGVLNYRTGKLDDGTDPYGWYERD